MKNILIVDDEPKIRNSYGSLLCANGFEAAGAATIEDVTETLNKKAVDLILLDLNMPEVDTKALHEEIRKVGSNAKVIVSSVYPVNRQVKCYPGAHDYFDKSEGTEILLEKIKEAFRKGQVPVQEVPQKANEGVRMNILLGLLKYPPDYAGDGLRLHRMFTRLRETKQVEDVFVISSWDQPEQKADQNRDGIQIFRPVEFTLKKEWKTYGQLKKIKIFLQSSFKIILLYLRLRRQVDMVFTSGSGWLPSLIAWLAKIDRKPFIKEIVLMGSDDPLTVARKPFFLRWIFTLPFRFADLVVTLSPVLKNACLQFGIPEKKIWFRFNPVILPPGIEEHPPVLLTSLPIILWVGVLSPRKNVEFLLAAAKYLTSPAQLCFVGPASDEVYMEKLTALAKQLPSAIKVRFLDKVDNQNRLYALYRQAKLFWFSSLKEGSPNVVAESLACGTPVVSLPIMGTVRPLMENAEDGEVVDTSNPQEFARVVDRWLKKDVSKESIAARARQRFDCRPIDSKYAEHFHRVINPKKSSPAFNQFSARIEKDLS